MYKILTIEDYEKSLEVLEANPLFTAWDEPDALIYIPIRLRIELQESIFRRDHQRFYKWIWENRQPHICEETGRKLRNYSAAYISHILSKGAHPEKAHDPRNINLLTFEFHQKWETGKRQDMRIFWRNNTTIVRLNKEYIKRLSYRIK